LCRFCTTIGVNGEQPLLRVMAGLDPAILLLEPAHSRSIGF
jgi:hypothetical protein